MTHRKLHAAAKPPVWKTTEPARSWVFPNARPAPVVAKRVPDGTIQGLLAWLGLL